MPKPKGANRETYAASHLRLLEVATRLFEAHGYDGVTTDQIAHAAGVAPGSLFHHFQSKKSLFVAVHNAYQEKLIEGISRAIAEALDPADRFDRMWRAYLESTEDAGMRRVLLLDGPKVIGLEALRQQDRQTAFAFFSQEVQALMDAGIFPQDNVRALSVLLFGALDQAAFEIADFPEDRALRRAILSSVENLIRALKQSGHEK